MWIPIFYGAYEINSKTRKVRRVIKARGARLYHVLRPYAAFHGKKVYVKLHYNGHVKQISVDTIMWSIHQFGNFT